MLDYQTAKTLYGAIIAEIEKNPKLAEESSWNDFVKSSINYVGYLANEYSRDKKQFGKYTETFEDGLTMQEFLNETSEKALSFIQKSIVGLIEEVSHELAAKSIIELLPDDRLKCEFAWYVAMFEIMEK